MSESPRDRLIQKLRESLEAGTFAKLTLSEPTPEADPELRNVYARLVELRDGRHLQCVRRYARRDVTENVPIANAAESIANEIPANFNRAYLFTTTGDWQWQGPGDGRLKAKRPTFTHQPPLEHDRQKVKATTGAPWLVALGVTAPDGAARPGMADKLRQIERFTELLGHLINDARLPKEDALRMVDLGAGKGYLTFAAHTFLISQGLKVETTGIELRTELVEAGNRIVRDLQIAGLDFKAGDIAGFEPGGPIDVLVALHACNTATDDALHLGIRSGARLILTAPCCHQEIRPQITAPPVLRPILRHGILLERHAESVTDAIRALLLEIHGYEAKVFEFISPEHTGKNLMISAVRRETPRDVSALRAELRELVGFHGIREQHLMRLLGEF